MRRGGPTAMGGAGPDPLIVSFVCAGFLAAQPRPKNEERPGTEAIATVLEKFEVTGSRMKRLDYETPAPVITYTAANIGDKGVHEARRIRAEPA